MDNYIAVGSLTLVPGGPVCIKSYIKQLTEIKDKVEEDEEKAPRVPTRMEREALTFLRDWFPGLLLGFITNMSRASGNALVAMTMTLHDQANGVNLSINDFAAMHKAATNAISVALPYLAAEDTGLANEAKKLDVLLEDYSEFIVRKDLDVHVSQRIAANLAARALQAQNFIDTLNRHKDQITENVQGKLEKYIFRRAQSETNPKPTGFWGRIVNWVKNKIGRGKAYGIPAIRPGELDLFITNLGLAYHLAATSSSLLEKIAKTSIMDRNCATPRALAPDMFESYIDEIEDTFEFLAPENVPTLDYILIKTKVDALISCAKVYISALNDETIESRFKIIQLRSICLLILNNLRDLVPICLKMDPLIAVMDI